MTTKAAVPKSGWAETAPHHLLDDGQPPLSCRTLVIGCGNLLRGDDAVGGNLIRLLWSRGIPDDLRMVDGGTAGMDVAFQMRGAGRVVIVDAACTGAEPGTIYRVPGAELEDLPDLTGLHTHSFRWDHAIAFARWLLGPEVPTDITVFLIEAANLEAGADLSEPVSRAMYQVADMLARDFFDDRVEVADDGYLRLSASLSDRYFPASVCGSIHVGSQLSLVPIQSQANGGFLLKQRTPNGDRCVLVRELTGEDLPPGVYPVRWNDESGALVVDLSAPLSSDRQAS